MAINFLDNIQLNQNQLLGARLENVTSDPATGTANGGDIIFNSTSNKLKYFNGTSWISLPDGIGIGGSGTVGSIPVFSSTTEITDSQLETSGSGSTQNFIFNTNGFVAMKGDLRVDTGGIYDSSNSIGTSGQLLSSTGTQISWINAPVSYTKWIADGGSATLQDVNDGDTYKLDESTTRPGVFAEPVTKLSTTITQPLGLFTKNMSLTSPNDYATDVLLWGTDVSADDWKVQKTKFTDVPISTWAEAEADLALGGFKITDVGAPTAGGDAANKTYVDNAIVGGFTVKGGFNASTGITAVAGTNLYTNTAVAVGDYYVVTVAGNFFGQASTPLTPGDSVLAQTAAASGSASITDFAVIQSDTDLATVTSVGIGNVNTNGPGNLDGLRVSYSSGTATVGVDIANNVSTSTAIGEMLFLVYDGGNTGDNLALPIEAVATYVNDATSFAGNNTSSGTSHTFTHSLGTGDVSVQLYDTSTKETVYATVDRTGNNTVVVTTASSIAAGAIRALITKLQ